MKTRHPKHKELGASYVQLIILIGLIALVTGAVLFSVGDTLVDTFKSNDEAMEASSLGNS